MATKKGPSTEPKPGPGEVWGRNGGDDQPAAAYVRLSAKGPTQEKQEEAIRACARAARLGITDEFVEVAAISEGDIVDRRMVLFELLGAAQAGRIKTVIVASWEAIAGAPAEAAIIALMMERSGADVIFADRFDVEPYREAASQLITGRD
ncbi:MAG TPA: recombinase family protein [Blastocatellia bacterium]